MKRFNPRKLFAILTLGMATALGTGSCGLMHDDLPPCATEVTTVVNFVYDYNMDGVDLFDRHAGSVYLYVFEDSLFVNRYEKNRVDLDQSSPDFSMTFDSETSDIKRGHTYQFVAVAQGSYTGYTALKDSLAGIDSLNIDDVPGFRLVNELVPGDSISKYILKLNRDTLMFSDFGVVDYTKDYRGEEALLDTVWTTMQVQVHTIPDLGPEQIENPVEEVKIPMMRVTNNIEVALYSPGFTASTRPADYDILLYYPRGNGTLNIVGDTLPEISQPLYYRALRKRVAPYTEKDGTRADGDEGDGTAQYAIYATFGVSRLIAGDESSLQIRDPETHELLAEIPNFSDYLSRRGNTDYDDPQEYLDREFDFKVDVGLTRDDRLWWSQVGIGILGWAVRDWYVGL